MQSLKNYIYKSLCLGLMILSSITYSQELNCSVIVNAGQIEVSNNRLFKTLENELTEFVNQNNWTKLDFQEHEKIKCGITITLTEQTGTNSFKGTIQVQASRPVYDATYSSPILNVNDKDFSFFYKEFQPINYNQFSFESELVGVTTYYIYTILGVYFNTFELNGGKEYLKTAQNIANQGQQSGGIGWSNSRLDLNRFTLNEQILSAKYADYAKAMFDYHAALDQFTKNLEGSKRKVLRSILKIGNLYKANPNNFLTRLFIDAKADEIVNIFKKKTFLQTENMVKVLRDMSPNNNKKWKLIK